MNKIALVFFLVIYICCNTTEIPIIFGSRKETIRLIVWQRHFPCIRQSDICKSDLHPRKLRSFKLNFRLARDASLMLLDYVLDIPVHVVHRSLQENYKRAIKQKISTMKKINQSPDENNYLYV